jgi:hypothetical protein
VSTSPPSGSPRCRSSSPHPKSPLLHCHPFHRPTFASSSLVSITAAKSIIAELFVKVNVNVNATF